MDGNDYFFQIENMEASESANSGKDHIDPEGLKRWEDEEMLDSIRHLFITEEDGDRPIVEGQDGEQDSNDDEDNAYDAGSSILQALKSQTPHLLVLPPSYPKQKLSNADSTPNTTNLNPLISTFTLIKRPKLPTN